MMSISPTPPPVGRIQNAGQIPLLVFCCVASLALISNRPYVQDCLSRVSRYPEVNCRVVFPTVRVSRRDRMVRVPLEMNTFCGRAVLMDSSLSCQLSLRTFHRVESTVVPLNSSPHTSR